MESNSTTLLVPLLADETEARRLLGGICAKTMFNLRRSGELRFVKLRGRVMYDIDELRHFVEARKEGHS